MRGTGNLDDLLFILYYFFCMMRLEFMERQQTLTICKGGRQALVLLGESEEKREQESPDGEKTDVTVYVYDATWLDLTKQHDPVAAAREEVLKQIAAYDTSSAVNGFMLNGAEVWLDFELRDRVYQGNERLQRIGRTDTTLWLGNKCYNLSIEQVQNIISHIEAYAKDCYNVTAAHKKAVGELTSVEEVLSYDYTKGYPEKLTMTV